MRHGIVLALLIGPAALGPAAQQRRQQTIPVPMRGHWTVIKDLSERSLGCFDPADAKALIGLKVEVGARQLVWNKAASDDVDPQLSSLSSYRFLFRYGKLPQELGIAPSPVTIVEVHPSEGIPVNALVAIDRSTILIDACNTWLLASRDTEASRDTDASRDADKAQPSIP